MLTTAEYGTYDLNSTTISLLVPILTLNITDSTLRFSLDQNSDKKNILSISIKYLLIGSVLTGVLVLVNKVFNIIPLLNQYSMFLFGMFIVFAISGVLSNFARGLDRVKEVAISGVFGASIMLILNLIFLLYFGWGLKGYFLANILASCFQCVYLFFSIKAYRYISINPNPDNLEKEMLDYSKPLIVNSISWWINASSDRYIVTWLCGIAENGIYSVGSKIPSIINVFQGIFNQAWTLSAVKDFDSEDKDGFFSKMYNLYNFCMVVICSTLIILTKLLAKILYANEFYEAWKYVPFLMMAIVFGALSGFIGGIFSAAKESKTFAKSSFAGAILNIGLNIALIYLIGTVGAAVATTISYFATWVIRIKHVKQYIALSIDVSRDLVAYTLLMIQTLLLFSIHELYLLYGLEITVLLIILVLYRHQINELVRNIKVRAFK